MPKAIIFDAFGVLIDASGTKNAALLEYILELRGGYKTALLSNISAQGFWRRFNKEELDTYFDAVVPSEEAGFVKPEPDAYLITAEKLGVKPGECVMVDDRQICVAGAEAVGMQAVLYQSLPQLKTDLKRLLADAL